MLVVFPATRSGREVGVPVKGAVGDAASRLELARGLLRRMEDRSDRSDAVRSAPVGPGEGRGGSVLPVAAPLQPLLSAGGLRRGSTVSVASGTGSTSLLFGLLTEASAQGMWAGVIGVPGLGAVAAAEAGIRLERLALVPRPGGDLVAVVLALLDGMDLVVVAGAQRAGLRGQDRQRLAARARQRGAVLLALGAWPGSDVELGCSDVRWSGAGRGAGRLCSRQVVVRSGGRGGAGAGRRAEVLLPGRNGAIGVPAAAPVPVVAGHEDARAAVG